MRAISRRVILSAACDVTGRQQRQMCIRAHENEAVELNQDEFSLVLKRRANRFQTAPAATCKNPVAVDFEKFDFARNIPAGYSFRGVR